MAFASTSVWEEAVLLALGLMPDSSVPPLCPWCLSGSCCHSAGAQREWDLQKELPGTSEVLSHKATIVARFYSQELGDFLAQEHWAGRSDVGL